MAFRRMVNENASAVVSGVTNTARKSSASNSITSLAGTLAAGNPLANLANIANAQQLQGTGQTSRNLTLLTTISARVVDVTPNGTLVIEGTKDIAVNSEKQTITVRGLVRPADLTTANTVQSTQVADLQVHVTGKGVVGDAIKRPFFLYRLLLGLLPF
jgi:flagellar L-ring protein precursor FlgH